MKYIVTALTLLFFFNMVATQVTYDFASVKAPKGSSVVFAEVFDEGWKDRWVVSANKDFEGKWQVDEGLPPYNFSGDKGLVVGLAARKHAISSAFGSVASNANRDEFVVQYELRLQKNLDCGGAYIKLLTAATVPKDLSEFSNETPYTIMFGPDKCGEQDKVHFIVRHKNPVSGSFEEKHVTNHPKIIRDTQTHLYTLVIKNDNTFQILVDQVVVRSGNFHEDFLPAFAPPKEIDDPTDKKPADWVDEAKIPDPEARKPDDWDEEAPELIDDPSVSQPDTWLTDEPEEIPNPEAFKPADWDDELDGIWEAPMVPNPKCAEFGCGVWKPNKISNPAYKGKWNVPLIDNPAYKGEWKPKQISNPHYFELKDPYKLEPMSAIGIELWTMTDGIMFDNIFIGYSKAEADNFASKTWVKKHAEEIRIKQDEDAKNAPGFFEQIKSTIEPFVLQFQQFLTDPNNTTIVIAAIAAAVVVPILMCVLVCSGGGEGERDKTKKGVPQDKKVKKE